MKILVSLPLIFLIATCLNIVECSSNINITLNCKISSCSADKANCGVACNIQSGLDYKAFTQVSKVEVEDVKMENVNAVSIKPQEMTQRLPKKLGEKFTSLKKLEVSSTQLEIIERSDFLKMENLKELNLANNQIEIVPVDVFNNLTSLEVLWLYANNIAELKPHTLNKLINLREFHVDMNKIERLGANFFLNNNKIERISLNENQLKSINENFEVFPNLVYIDLRKNFRECTACPTLSEEKFKTRFESCGPDSANEMLKTREIYVECVKAKLTKTENSSVLIEPHLKVLNGGNTTIQLIDYIEKQSNIDKGLRDLLFTCRAERGSNSKAVTDNYDNCMLCLKANQPDFIDKCELRFVKDYEPDDKVVGALKKFNEDVKKYFPAS